MEEVGWSSIIRFINIRRLLIISFMAFATIFTFSGCSKDAAYLQNEVMSVFDDKYVTQVKKGHLQMAPMGLHAGSSLQEVLNVYGAGYMLSTYGDLDLYEYKYKDENQRAYLLRFAVKQNSGVVNYISIRYVD